MVETTKQRTARNKAWAIPFKSHPSGPPPLTRSPLKVFKSVHNTSLCGPSQIQTIAPWSQGPNPETIRHHPISLHIPFPGTAFEVAAVPTSNSMVYLSAYPLVFYLPT